VSHVPDPSIWGWSSKLSHWIGSLWRIRIHQWKHIRSARDIADGRQHVLRAYTWDGHDGLDRGLGLFRSSDGRRLTERVAYVAVGDSSGDEAILKLSRAKADAYDARRRGLKKGWWAVRRQGGEAVRRCDAGG
jgi:hypothetical protein